MLWFQMVVKASLELPPSGGWANAPELRQQGWSPGSEMCPFGSVGCRYGWEWVQTTSSSQALALFVELWRLKPALILAPSPLLSLISMCACGYLILGYPWGPPLPAILRYTVQLLCLPIPFYHLRSSLSTPFKAWAREGSPAVARCSAPRVLWVGTSRLSNALPSWHFHALQCLHYANASICLGWTSLQAAL